MNLSENISQKNSYRILDFIESRELDIYTQKNWGFAPETLMGIAAKSFIDVYRSQFLESESRLILSGKGNNGGDGYTIAYFLKTEGIDSHIVEWGENRSSTAEFYREKCIRLGICIDSWDTLMDIFKNLPPHVLVLDCILGTGAKPDLPKEIETTIEFLKIWKKNRISDFFLCLDSPTGGELYPMDELGEIGCYKLENIRVPKKSKSLVPIGFPIESYINDKGKKLLTNRFYWENIDVSSVKQFFVKNESDHKYKAGSAIFIGGEEGMEGALVLALSSFLGLGGGIAKAFFFSPEAKNLYSAQNPSWMIQEWTEKSTQDPFWQKTKTVVFGPGTLAGKSYISILNFLKDWSSADNDRRVILDAGTIASIPKMGVMGNKNWLLTPHLGEFQNLIGENILDRPDLISEKAAAFSNKNHYWLLIKTAISILSSPDSSLWIWDYPNSKLATMGTGDLLTGIIAILLSRGYSMDDAVYLSLNLTKLTESMTNFSPTSTEILEYLKAI